MPEKEEITAKILDILETDLKWPISRSEITDDTNLGSDGVGLDSVMIISVTVQLEEAFGISIPDEDIIELADNTLGQVAEYVRDRVASNA